MFDISFAELIIIMIVGLVVLGPERLPVVARTIGHLLGRAQRYVEGVKNDLRDEIELDNLRKLQDNVRDNVNSLEDSLNKEMSQIQQSADISSAIAGVDSGDGHAEQKSVTLEIPAQSAARQESAMNDSASHPASQTTEKNQRGA